MPQLGIKGGSAGEVSRDFKSPFFHAGVKAKELRVKDIHKLRVLPAFDRAQYRPEDPQFTLSYIPYRDKHVDPDKSTKTEGFTDWFFELQGYTFLGKGQKGFLSPLNVGGRDPILDCYNFVKKSADNSIKHLIARPEEKNKSAIIPLPRTWAFMNAYLQVENAWDNYLVYCSISGFGNLKEKLALRAGRNDHVVSPEWPDYIYGDITHPTQGLLATVAKGSVGTGKQNIETSLFNFSAVAGRLDGAQSFPLDPATPLGQTALKGRYNILDGETVLKVATYEEILNYIVADGVIPYDIIFAACSEHTTSMPPRPASARQANGAPPEDDDNIPMGGPAPLQGYRGPSAPAPAPLPPPTVVAPAAAPAAFVPQPLPVASAPAALPVATAPVAAPTAFVPAPLPVASAPQPLAYTAAPTAPVAAAVGALPPPPVGMAPAGTRVTTALAPQATSTASPEQIARYTDLTTRMAQNPAAGLSDADMRELTQLAVIVNAR